jgi:hypothetical protein
MHVRASHIGETTVHAYAVCCIQAGATPKHLECGRIGTPACMSLAMSRIGMHARSRAHMHLVAVNAADCLAARAAHGPLRWVQHLVHGRREVAAAAGRQQLQQHPAHVRVVHALFKHPLRIAKQARRGAGCMWYHGSPTATAPTWGAAVLCEGEACSASVHVCTCHMWGALSDTLPRKGRSIADIHQEIQTARQHDLSSLKHMWAPHARALPCMAVHPLPRYLICLYTGATWKHWALRHAPPKGALNCRHSSRGSDRPST